jgi:hypothetical protein
LETDETTKRIPIKILINVTSILGFYFKKLLINFFFLLKSSMIYFCLEVYLIICLLLQNDSL